MKLKQLASGWPSECDTEEKKKPISMTTKRMKE